MKKLERIHFIARADRLAPVRQFVRELARQQGCCEENLEHLVMAINEACMNVIQHAYRGDENGEVVIEFWKADDELTIKIIDFAEYADLESIKSRDLDDVRPGGLGVHLIHQVMDYVEYKHQPDMNGNVLELRKQLGVDRQCTAGDRGQE